ncbi:MAG TPA: hypothetical protein VHM70_14060 [Polyangiaceae bacterium]|nr:hypothetical protein [Polyangiaceae bacterium]
MDNGLVNLAAIVSMLVFCLILIPIVLVLGTPKNKRGEHVEAEAKTEK